MIIFIGSPRIVSAPVSSITIKEKDPLRLICSVEGDPSTRVTWIREHDNAIIGEGETLVISNVNESDAGGYFCKAENGNTAAALIHTKVNVQCKSLKTIGVLVWGLG